MEPERVMPQLAVGSPVLIGNLDPEPDHLRVEHLEEVDALGIQILQDLLADDVNHEARPCMVRAPPWRVSSQHERQRHAWRERASTACRQELRVDGAEALQPCATSSTA